MDTVAHLPKIAMVVDGGKWHTSYLHADGVSPSVAHTMGLWRNFKVPEIVVTGVKESMAFELLDVIANALIQRRVPLELKRRYDDFLDGASVEFIQVDEASYDDFLEDAVWFYVHHTKPAESFPALQCVLPENETGLFPWDDGFPEALERIQPLLGLRV